MRTLLVLVCSSLAALIAQPPDPAGMRRLAQEGEQALSERRYADAAAAYDKLRRLDPASAEVHARLGLIYFQQGRFNQAIAPLRQALKLKPSLPNTDVLLAMCLSETGRFEEALPGLEKGFRRTADPVLKRMSGLHLQRALLGLGRDAKAAEVALDLTKSYPDDPEVLYHASRLFANYAYLAMRRLTDAAPESVWRMLASGEIHESQGNYELAVAAYREVLAKEPTRPGVYYRIGRTLLAGRDPALLPEARRAFEMELRNDPTNANAAYELGELDRKAGELDAARSRFEAALRHDPNFAEAAIAVGRTLLAQDKPDLALPHLRRAASLQPGNEVAYYHLAQAYRKLGDAAGQQKALAEFRRLREQRAAHDSPLLQDVTRQEVDSAAK